MALDDDIRVLSGVRLLEDLTQEQLRLLAFGAENIRLIKGRDLYREETAADCAYVVTRGLIGLYRTVDGERRIFAHAGPGSVLDEMALLTHVRRRIGAMAEEDSDVIRLNRVLFRRILEEYPDVAVRLRDRLANEISDLADDAARLLPRFED
jgi:CRP-like cAMP-binding protein